MTRLGAALVVLAIVLIAFAGMYFGWRALKKRQSHIATPELLPHEFHATSSLRGLYLATTLADKPLERIVVHGLGFKSNGTFEIGPQGIAVHLTSENPILIPSEDLSSVERASWTIDSGVEPDGLVKIRWRLGAQLVDSYFRPDGDPSVWIVQANNAAKLDQEVGDNC